MRLLQPPHAASGSGSSSATWSAAATLIDHYPKFNHNPTLILTLILIPILNIFFLVQNLAKYANAYANLIMNIHRLLVCSSQTCFKYFGHRLYTPHTPICTANKKYIAAGHGFGAYFLPPRPRGPCQTVIERNAPYRAGPINRHASRSTTDRLQVLLRPLTYCHVLLRSPRFTTAYYVSHPHHDCRGNFFDSLKIWPGIHGNHGLSRFPTVPYPVSPRCLTSPHVHPVLSTVA